MSDLEQIIGLTPAAVTKLQEAGINTTQTLIMLNLNQLREILKILKLSDKDLKQIQESAWKKMGYWFTPGTKLTEMRATELIFSTGASSLDKLLEGGVRSRSITELAGAYGAGKTETLLTIMVEALKRNPEITALFMDTEETFKDVRVIQIAKARDADPSDILNRTIYTPIFHTQHFLEMINQSDLMLKARNTRLILVDSITASLRAEYIGRETLWQRQQLLNRILRTLFNYAKAFNLAVVVTNQVVADPQIMFTHDPVALNPPIGGNILAHSIETRLYLRKAKETTRIVRLIDSSWLPPGECTIQINERGIGDVEEKKKPAKKDEEAEKHE